MPQDFSVKEQQSTRSRSPLTISLRGLSKLTLGFALAALFLMELTDRFGAITAVIAVLGGLSIFAHVAGALVGSRSASATKPTEEDLATTYGTKTSADAEDFAPATELSRQQPLTRKPIYWAVGLGACGSSILASIILTLVMWENLAIINVLFGAVSAAVIGGLMGFWISSFFQVVRSALAEAQKNT